MLKNEPLVSVVIPTFNREQTILRAVSSVLDQDYKNIQLLVVDDGSNDKTLELLQGIDDLRLSVIHCSKNAGAAAARNIGLAAAKGEYIALLDSDDEWLQDKLANQIPILEAQSKGSVFSCTNAFLYGENHPEFLLNSEPSDLEVHLHTNCNLGAGSTLVINSKCLSEIGLLDERFTSSMEDWDWILRMSINSKFVYIDQALSKIYVGDGRRSGNLVEESTIYFLEKHQELIRERGKNHERFVFANHWMRLAQIFFEQRASSKGFRYFLRSLAVRPIQKPGPVIYSIATWITAVTGLRLRQRIEKFAARNKPT